MKPSFRLSFPRIAALFLALLVFDATGLSTALAQPSDAPPAASGPTKVYFNECGHFLEGGFLTYWRTHGRDYLLGCPISEVFRYDTTYLQYFKKARVEYHPENAGTPDEFVLGLIGSEIYNAMSPEEKANPAFARVDPIVNNRDHQYFSETGHTISFGIKTFWTSNNGLRLFGLPISEEYPYFDGDKNYSAQDFERARLLFNPSTGVLISDHGVVAASANNIGTLAVNPDPAVPNFSSNLWEHWVDVNLSGQYTNFMEGDVSVLFSYVTTGKPGHQTPTGTYYINQRVANEHMRGGSIGAEDYYDLYNVLYTQYFTYEGHALHYAWWRSNFGVTGSHGCVNMDYNTSLFAWNWVGIGSRVTIHY